MSESSTPTPPDPGPGTPADATGAHRAPGAGSPLVPGPPQSVSPAIPGRKINTFFGAGGVLVIIAVIVLVVLVGLLVINIAGRH